MVFWLGNHGAIFGPNRWAVEAEVAASLEDSIDDCLGEIVVMENRAPASRVLVCREDHRPLSNVPVVDHMGMSCTKQ